MRCVDHRHLAARAGRCYDDDGNYVGERGWAEPKRTYKAVEFVLDRAWDEKWAFNASYTLVVQRRQRGRSGQLRHQLRRLRSHRGLRRSVGELRRLRLPAERSPPPVQGARRLRAQRQLAVRRARSTCSSGRPISAFGVGNPFDGTELPQLLHLRGRRTATPDRRCRRERVYVVRGRGDDGRTPWTYDVGASITYLQLVRRSPTCDVKFAIFNLLDQQRALEVDDDLRSRASARSTIRLGCRRPRFQSPRFAQLTVTVEF